MTSTKSTVLPEHLGFIGLGNMGGAIALRLLRAGYPLTVLDLDHEAHEMPAILDDVDHLERAAERLLLFLEFEEQIPRVGVLLGATGQGGQGQNKQS